MRKHSISILATLLFATALLTGCGNGSNNGSNETQPNNESTDYINDTPYTAYTTEGGFEIPLCPLFGRPLYEYREGRLWALTAGFTETPMDLRDRNIHIVTDNYYFFNYWPQQDATPNETHRIMAQLRNIEEDYNMTFSFAPAPRATFVWEHVLQARLAGEVSSEIININITHGNPDIMFRQNVFIDLYSPQVSHIFDFENNPWHEGRQMSNLWGMQFGVHFTTANSGAMLTSMLTFNMDFAENFQLGNFHEMVHNGSWNFSNFESILRWVQYHSNGNILPMAAASEGGVGPGFIFANGGRTVIRNDLGHLEFVATHNDRALEAVQYLADLANLGLFEIIPGLIPGIGNRPYEMFERAAAGGIMFMSGGYEIVRRFTRQQTPSEFLFGLLPIPKGDHMDDYVSAMYSFDMYYIVYGVHNPQEVAAILVALANRTSKLYIIEHELRFGVRSPECAEILEMMLARQEIDYSRMVSVRGRISTQIRDAIHGFATPRTSLERIETSVNQTLADLIIPPSW